MYGCWRDTVSRDCEMDIKVARCHGPWGGPSHLNGLSNLSSGGLLCLCVVSWNMIPRAMLALSAFLRFSIMYFQPALPPRARYLTKDGCINFSWQSCANQRPRYNAVDALFPNVDTHSRSRFLVVCYSSHAF